jgi:hypothetical protein
VGLRHLGAAYAGAGRPRIWRRGPPGPAAPRSCATTNGSLGPRGQASHPSTNMAAAAQACGRRCVCRWPG